MEKNHPDSFHGDDSGKESGQRPAGKAEVGSGRDTGLGCQGLSEMANKGTGRARDLQEDAITYENLAKFNRQAPQITTKYPDINIMFGSLVARQNSIRLNELGLRLGGPDGFTRFNLTPDGSMYAGGYAPYISPDLKLGNIKEEEYTTLRVWRESEKLNSFREFSGKMVERCLTCPELGVNCGGTNVEMELVKLHFPDQDNPYCIYD